MGEASDGSSSLQRGPLAGESGKGFLYALGAFFCWGVFPIYFKAVGSVHMLEVLAHRVTWSAVLLVAFLAWRGRAGELVAVLRNRDRLWPLCLTTILIASNWLIFIWAIGRGQLLQCSLGYFINPLVHVLLGCTVLSERLRPWQKISVLVTAGGVAYLTATAGTFPAVAILLALTFGLYALIRKMTRVDSVVGLTTETMLLAPLAAGYVVWLMARGEATFGGTWDHLDWLLLAAGVVTSLPLLWFVNAARLLPLSRVGLMQYIAPTLQFLLAVLAYREPFTRDHLVSFGLVWTGLAVFVWDSLRAARLTAQPVAAEPVEAPAVAGACCGGGAR